MKCCIKKPTHIKSKIDRSEVINKTVAISDVELHNAEAACDVRGRVAGAVRLAHS